MSELGSRVTTLVELLVVGFLQFFSFLFSSLICGNYLDGAHIALFSFYLLIEF